MRRIVVGVDGSEASVGALRWAQDVAGPDDTVHVVVGWSTPTAVGAVDGLPPPAVSLEVLGDNARRILDDVLGLVPAGDVTRSSSVETEIASGTPSTSQRSICCQNASWLWSSSATSACICQSHVSWGVRAIDVPRP